MTKFTEFSDISSKDYISKGIMALEETVKGHIFGIKDAVDNAQLQRKQLFYSVQLVQVSPLSLYIYSELHLENRYFPLV